MQLNYAMKCYVHVTSFLSLTVLSLFPSPSPSLSPPPLLMVLRVSGHWTYLHAIPGVTYNFSLFLQHWCASSITSSSSTPCPSYSKPHLSKYLVSKVAITVKYCTAILHIAMALTLVQVPCRLSFSLLLAPGHYHVASAKTLYLLFFLLRLLLLLLPLFLIISS